MTWPAEYGEVAVAQQALVMQGPGGTASAVLTAPAPVEAPPPPALSPHAAVSWLKLATGFLGLTLGSLWWLALFAVLAESTPDGTIYYIAWGVTVLLSLVPTLLLLWLFRSGLRELNA